MPRAKASVSAPTSTVVRSGAAASAIRSSNPHRAAASKKRVSYFEQNDDEDEEMEEGNTTLVNPEDDEEEDDFREETPAASTFEMAQLLKVGFFPFPLSLFNPGNASEMTFFRVQKHISDSRAKSAKNEAAKAEKLMKEQFDGGQKQVDSLVAKHFEESDARLAGLNLNDVRGFSRLDAKSYRSVFAEQEALKTQLVATIDDFQKEMYPDQEEWIEMAKQALQARPHHAKKAYKKFAKSANAVVQERRMMAELHQGAAHETYRHFKDLARL
ncbi:hypothetical protein JCM11251_001336 [Rhodosporidiobolus azoricus]